MRHASRVNALCQPAAVLLLVSACGGGAVTPAPVASRVARAAGCYDLVSLPSRKPERGALTRVRLLAEPVSEQRPQYHRLQLLPEGDSLRDAFAQLRLWRVDSLTDTVRVQAGDGFAAHFFRGSPTSNGDLVGVTGAAGDVGPPFEHNVHSAMLSRRACPGPLR